MQIRRAPAISGLLLAAVLAPGCRIRHTRTIEPAGSIEAAREPEPASTFARGGPHRRVRRAYLLRIPPELYEAMRAWADSEVRSLNAQIEYVLREALERRGREAALGEGSPPADGITPAPGGVGEAEPDP